MKKADWRYLLLCLILVGGCSAFQEEQFTESSPQGTAEEVRLKAVLLEADDIAGSAIDVTIDDDRLVLEGFVEKESQRQRAEELMQEHGDVDEVVNRIEVK